MQYQEELMYDRIECDKKIQKLNIFCTPFATVPKCICLIHHRKQKTVY